jgi:hypothetical protein
VQFSSNSNAAIAAMVSEHPTVIGQWRAAMMQLHDRQDALDSQDLERRITMNKIEKIEEQIKLLSDGESASCIANILEVEGLELEIEKLRLELTRSDRLVADAERELSVALRLVDQIVQQAGFDPAELTEAQQQELMTEEFHIKRLRWFVSQLSAPFTGVSPEVLEMFMSMPSEQMQQIMLEHQIFVRNFNGESTALLQGEANGNS